MVRIFKRLRRTRSTAIHTIGAASRVCGIPIYTLRWIESHGLLAPRRTRGNHRLFSEEDLELLEQIADLLAQKVNLAGIRVILRMKKTGVSSRPA